MPMSSTPSSPPLFPSTMGSSTSPLDPALTQSTVLTSIPLAYLNAQPQHSGNPSHNPSRPSQRPLDRANRPDPHAFGHIPGVEPGTLWPSRAEVSQAGVHAPYQAGISGTEERGGAASVVLNDGYPDGDGGDIIWYMGSGGFTCPFTRKKCTSMQHNQDPDNVHNRALRQSLITGQPVRVIRGPHAKHSPWAPEDEYRYDGLYKVTRAQTIDDPTANTSFSCLLWRMERIERHSYQIPVKPGCRRLAEAKAAQAQQRKLEEDQAAQEGLTASENQLLERTKASTRHSQKSSSSQYRPHTQEPQRSSGGCPRTAASQPAQQPSKQISITDNKASMPPAPSKSYNLIGPLSLREAMVHLKFKSTKPPKPPAPPSPPALPPLESPPPAARPTQSFVDHLGLSPRSSPPTLLSLKNHPSSTGPSLPFFRNSSLGSSTHRPLPVPDLTTPALAKENELRKPSSLSQTENLSRLPPVAATNLSAVERELRRPLPLISTPKFCDIPPPRDRSLTDGSTRAHGTYHISSSSSRTSPQSRNSASGPAGFQPPVTSLYRRRPSISPSKKRSHISRRRSPIPYSRGRPPYPPRRLRSPIPLPQRPSTHGPPTRRRPSISPTRRRPSISPPRSRPPRSSPTLHTRSSSVPPTCNRQLLDDTCVADCAQAEIPRNSPNEVVASDDSPVAQPQVGKLSAESSPHSPNEVEAIDVMPLVRPLAGEFSASYARPESPRNSQNGGVEADDVFPISETATPKECHENLSEPQDEEWAMELDPPSPPPRSASSSICMIKRESTPSDSEKDMLDPGTPISLTLIDNNESYDFDFSDLITFVFDERLVEFDLKDDLDGLPIEHDPVTDKYFVGGFELIDDDGGVDGEYDGVGIELDLDVFT